MENFVNNSPLILVIVFLVIGFCFLIKGADFFVEGSSSIAKRLLVPPIIIGLTIVAMGTSLPETAVSVSASLVGNNELAISNVVGSNIFNLVFVVGVCAILSSITVQRETVTRDIPFSMICALLLLGLGILALGDRNGMTLGRLDGIIFLALFAGYILLMIRSAMKARSQETEIDEFVREESRILSLPRSLIYIVGGAAAIAFGGDLTVDAASRIAIDLGMSQTLVGLTIVSIGTSLPELVTSIVAARKNEVEMAVGNAVGSNIFNILMVLGIASAINPITLIREKLPGYVHADPFEIQIMTPMRKGALGVERLNSILQEYLNPKSPDKAERESGGVIYRVGDKVMQIKNNYQIEWEIRNRYGIPVDGGTGVFNGDIGRIRSINTFAEHLTVEFDEGKMVDYSFRQLEELELAYAITIHKSQGSEYPAVVVPVHSGPRMLMTRNLIYTAVTRARSCVCLVGIPETFQAMVNNEMEQRRYTGLKARLKEIMEEDMD